MSYEGSDGYLGAMGLGEGERGVLGRERGSVRKSRFGKGGSLGEKGFG
jgi:hypothetical protein